MASGVMKTMSGSFVSNGAAKTVEVGFKPARVEIQCSLGDNAIWFEPMAEASMNKSVAGGTNSRVTSNGVTPTNTGFTLGADADVNASGETVYWWASE